MKLFLCRSLTIFLWFFVLGALVPVQGQTTQTFSSGSYIIDMGVAPQTYSNCPKPYGLVYALLPAGVPIVWSITSTEGKDGIDFTHTGNFTCKVKEIFLGEERDFLSTHHTFCAL